MVPLHRRSSGFSLTELRTAGFSAAGLQEANRSWAMVGMGHEGKTPSTNRDGGLMAFEHQEIRDSMGFNGDMLTKNES